MLRSMVQLTGILTALAASACFQDPGDGSGADDESGDTTGTSSMGDGTGGDDGGTGSGGGTGGDDGGTGSGGGTTGGTGGTGTGDTSGGTGSTGGDTSTTGATGTGSGVMTCADPLAPDCGDHGICVDDVAGPICECDKGYGGALCDECTEGYVEDDNLCVADCGDCGPHAFCDETPEIPACACVAAYVNNGGACEWGGGLQDPLYAEGDTYWLPVATAIDPTQFGPGDGGATFSNIGLCGLSSVSQAVEMPAYVNAEPLVLEVVGYSNAGGGMDECDAGAYLRVNSGYVNLQFPGGSPATATACLGAAAFGGPIDFALVADALSNDGSGDDGDACFEGDTPCTARTFRETSIRTAAPGECPEPGALRNPDFAAGEADWTFYTNDINGYPMWAEVQAGAAVLHVERTCSMVNMSQTMSFPMAADVPNPALRLSQTGTDGKPLHVLLNGRPWMTVLGNGGLRTSNLCVPEYAKGMAFEVTLQLNTQGGGCGGDDVRDFALDDFAFVSEAGCAAPNASIDGGFENSTPGATETPWALSRGGYSNNDAHVAILLNAAAARTGNGVLRLTTEGVHQFGDAAAQVRVQVPQPGGGSQPALRFWYRSVDAGGASVTVTPGAYVVPESAQPNVYEMHEVCLDPDWAGQIVPVVLELNGGTQGVGPGAHWVDDVDVVLSSGC